MEHHISGHWFEQREVEVEVLFVVAKWLVELLQVEVEGGLVEHTVLQELLGVQLGVEVQCRNGCNENLLVLDLPIR